jgi:PadR family transcriptional regulator, regulatory protein PadR
MLTSGLKASFSDRDNIKLYSTEEIGESDILSEPDYWERSFMAGSTKLYILSVLSKGPLHGYGVLKEIKDKSDGCCTITPGTIYPVLRELERDGFIVSSKAMTGGRTRITYELTDRGKQVLDAGLAKWESHIEGAKKILGL